MQTLRWVPDRPRVIRESPRAHWFAVVAVCMGAFMIQVDASIVTLTLHSMQLAFNASLGAVAWVSLSYLLVMVATVVPLGRLSDAVGRKQMYLAGFAVFTLGSAACALAPSLPALIGARVIQAVGAATIATNSVAVVTQAMPRPLLRAGLSVQSSVQALGLALGPVIGGLLVAAFGWRSVFVVNLPVGVVAIVVGLVLLPRGTTSTQRRLHLDWPGTVLAAVSVVAVLLVASGVSGVRFPTALVIVFLLAGITAAPAFWWWEQRAADPLVSPTLIGVPAVRWGLVAASLSYLLLYAPLVLMPQLLIPLGHGEDSVGPIVAALPLGFMVAAVGADRFLPAAIGPTQRMVGGAGAVALAAVVLFARPTDIATVVPALAVFGVGCGVVVPAVTTAVMGATPPEQTGTASGLLSMVRNTGTALGVASVTLALHLADHDSRNRADVAGSHAHRALVLGGHYGTGVLVVIAAIAVLVTLRLTGRRR